MLSHNSWNVFYCHFFQRFVKQNSPLSNTWSASYSQTPLIKLFSSVSYDLDIFKIKWNTTVADPGFSGGGTANPKWGANLFYQFLLKTAWKWKWKQLWPRGKRRAFLVSPNSVNGPHPLTRGSPLPWDIPDSAQVCKPIVSGNSRREGQSLNNWSRFTYLCTTGLCDQIPGHSIQHKHLLPPVQDSVINTIIGNSR